MSKIDLYKGDWLKFKGWDKKEKKILKFSDQELAPCRWVYDGGIDDMFGNSEEDVIWLLYSGFNDLKNNEIYVGDILKGRNDNKYVVVFERGAFYLYHTTEKDFDGTPRKWGLLSRLFDADFSKMLPFFEVIGTYLEDTVVEKGLYDE